VNQGFQTLRHHIPESYRLKKMSKVDTLRCALDYIRNLERILQLPDSLVDSYSSSPQDQSSTMTSLSSSSIIFSSEDEDLFIQSESPSSYQTQEDSLSLMDPNNGIRSKNNNNNESEEPSELGQEQGSDNLGNNENDHEGRPVEDGIMICHTERTFSANGNNSNAVDVIGVVTDLDSCTKSNENGILIVTTNVSGSLQVVEMRVTPETHPQDICNGSGQSHGHYSDSYSDIENLDHEDDRNSESYHY
jgi:hypothetical protein